MSGMFRIFLCKKCKTSFSVSALDPEAHLLKKIMRCPNADDCKGKLREYAQTNIGMANSPKVTALTLYQASLGVGMPQERICGSQDMRTLLVGAKIQNVHLEDSPDPKRSIIYSISLNSGRVVHLSTSVKGATIYKVTESKHAR